MSQILCNKAYSYNTMPKSADELISSSIEFGKIEQVFIIVPTGKLVRRLKMAIIRKYFELHQKPVAELNIFTLSKFIQDCHSKSVGTGRKRIVSDAYRLTLFEEASEKANLQFFIQSGKKASPLILKRLADVIFGLKEDGITELMLQKEIANAIACSDKNIDIRKMSDILAIFKCYNEVLSDKFLDSPDVLNTTINKIRLEIAGGGSPFEKIFPDNPIIFFNGFSEFKNPEIEFISLFADCSIPTAVNVDYSTRIGPLFGNFESDIIKLWKKSFPLYPEEDESNRNPVPNQLTDWLRFNLFRYEKIEPNKELSDIIKIIATDNKVNEVVAIARLIRYLILEKKYQPWEICVASRSPERYSSYFRELFSIYKIPANISDRFILAKSPVVVAVFSVLGIISDGYKKDDIHKAVLSPYLNFGDNNDFDGMNLISVANNHRITGGARRMGAYAWTNTLSKIIPIYQKRINDNQADNSIGKKPDYSTSKNLEACTKALKDFYYLFSLLPERKEKYYTADEFRTLIIENVLGNFKVKDQIIKLYKSIEENKDNLSKLEQMFLLEEVEKDSRAFSALISLIDEMVFIINDRTPNQKFKPEELIQRLKTAVGAKKYQIREKQNFGVDITSVEQTRGIPYPVMILCGALDKEFPFSYNPETFLGKEMEITEKRHYFSEKMLFYQFLTNSPAALNNKQKEIYITYHKTKDDEELVRSPFIDSLLKITTLEKDDCVFDLPQLTEQSKSDNEAVEKLKLLPWLDSIAYEGEAVKLFSELEYMRLTSKPDIDNTFSNQPNNTRFKESTEYISHILLKNISQESDSNIDIEKLNEEQKKSLTKIETKAISVSELEDYAKCPYLYFSKRILGWEEEQELSLELTALEIGNLFHEILFQFYSKLQQEEKANDTVKFQKKPKDTFKEKYPDLATVTLDGEKIEEYRKSLHTIAEDVLQSYDFSHAFFELDKEELLGNANKLGWVDIWLNRELERIIYKNWQFAPALFEFRFSTKLENTLAENDDDIKSFEIKGFIDRIEFLEDPENPYIIADYKTGNADNLPANNDVIKGLSFQMPLYLAASRKVLLDVYAIDAMPNGSVYYLLKPKYEKGNKSSYEKFLLLPKSNHLYASRNPNSTSQLLKDKGLEDVIAMSVKLAAEIIKNIKNGKFPVEPNDPQICKYCNFHPICRINEKRQLMSYGEDEGEEKFFEQNIV